MRSKLFEFISRKNDEESPKISAIIINPKTGEPDYAKMVESENMNTPRTFADRLFGRTLTKDYETNNIDEKGNADIQTHRASHTRGGLISDFIKGYEENYNDDFNINNLRGAKKSIANRIGEGLGTITRGLAGSLGDSYIAGVYGLPAAMQRQNLRVGDKIYRQDLANFGIDTNNINGFIDSNTYGNLIRSQQLRDNEKYRNEILKSNLAQQEALQDYRNKQLNYDWATLQERINARKAEQGKANKNLNNLEAVSNQLVRFEDTFKTMPGKIESNTLGRLRNATGFQTPQEANFNSQRTLLFNKIARDLGGEKGVLSDQDIKRIEASLPNYTDSFEQKQAKMQAVYDLLEDRLTVEGVTLDKAKTSQKDSLGIL